MLPFFLPRHLLLARMSTPKDFLTALTYSISRAARLRTSNTPGVAKIPPSGKHTNAPPSRATRDRQISHTAQNYAYIVVLITFFAS